MIHGRSPALREVRAGTQSRSCGEQLLSDMLSQLSYMTQNLPRAGIAQCGLGHPILIINNEDDPTNVPTGQSGLGVPQLSLSYQVTTGCDRLSLRTK